MEFFKAQFSAEQHSFEFPLIQKLIPSMVKEGQNNASIGVLNEAEIKAIIFDMNADGAASPDGFNGHFYKHCWEIIKDGLIVVVFSRVKFA